MKKLKVNFYLKGDKKNADDNIAIYAKIYLGNQYSTFSTSKYISKVRVSDITYIQTKDGFVYLTTIMDLYNRKLSVGVWVTEWVQKKLRLELENGG